MYVPKHSEKSGRFKMVCNPEVTYISQTLFSKITGSPFANPFDMCFQYLHF